MELPKHYFYFEKNDRKFYETINGTTTEIQYDFGFIHDRYLTNYILCRIVRDQPVAEIDIYRVSSHKTYPDSVLFTFVEQKAKDLGIQRISVLVIGDKWLRKWYESIGYSRIQFMSIKNNKSTSYFMQKNLTL